jgi:hypothetical protein
MTFTGFDWRVWAMTDAGPVLVWHCTGQRQATSECDRLLDAIMRGESEYTAAWVERPAA